MTIMGSLPPSSKVTRLISRPATSMTWRPTGVEPVKAMRRTRGLRSSSSPTLPPGPVTMFTVPLGKCLLRLAFAEGRLGDQFDDFDRGKRSGAGRLDDDRVAGGERRAELGAHQSQREIPRHDAAAHADRLAHDHAVGAFLRQRHVRAAHFGGETRVEFQAVDEMMNLQARFEQRSCPALGSVVGRSRRYSS